MEGGQSRGLSFGGSLDVPVSSLSDCQAALHALLSLGSFWGVWTSITGSFAESVAFELRSVAGPTVPALVCQPANNSSSEDIHTWILLIDFV